MQKKNALPIDLSFDRTDWAENDQDAKIYNSFRRHTQRLNEKMQDSNLVSFREPTVLSGQQVAPGTFQTKKDSNQ